MGYSWFGLSTITTVRGPKGRLTRRPDNRRDPLAASTVRLRDLMDSGPTLLVARHASHSRRLDAVVGRHRGPPLVLALLSGGGEMSTLTIRQLDERTHARLRGQAAEHGRSVEAEVRAILDAAVNRPERNLLLALHASMSEVGGVDLELVPRTDKPRPVDIS